MRRHEAIPSRPSTGVRVVDHQRLTAAGDHDSGSLHHGRIGQVGAEPEDLNSNGTRIDPRMDTLYARFRERRITRSEVITRHGRGGRTTPLVDPGGPGRG